MFIPPSKLQEQLRAQRDGNKAPVRLQSSHLLIDREVASEAFGNDQNVYTIYYPDKRTLMIAPVSDEVFKKLHKAAQQMLKDRNQRGDKSIALHETLIDHAIDDTDRDLEYELQKGLGILNVKL